MTLLVFIGSLLGAMAIGVPGRLCPDVLRRRADVLYGHVQHADHCAEHDCRRRHIHASGHSVLHSRRRTDELRRPVRRIIDFAIACVGHIRGGLGIVAIFAAVIMA